MWVLQVKLCTEGFLGGSGSDETFVETTGSAQKTEDWSSISHKSWKAHPSNSKHTKHCIAKTPVENLFRKILGVSFEHCCDWSSRQE
jgi:hypothetical protein